jgi:hypothetical protein
VQLLKGLGLLAPVPEKPTDEEGVRKAAEQESRRRQDSIEDLDDRDVEREFREIMR